MSNASSPDTLRRFAHDLGALREARGVGLDQLQQTSKIPIHVLKDFETDALLANPVFNRVYLRSLVKTYADALRLDAPAILRDLERAYDGSYTALEATDEVETPAPDGPVPVGTAAPVGTTARQQATSKTPAPKPPSTAAKDTQRAPAPTPAAFVETTPRAPADTERAALEQSTNTGAASPAPRRVAVDTPHTPVGDAFTSAAYDNRYEPRQVPSWVPVLVGVVALLGLIGGIVWWLGRSPSAAEPERTTPAPAASTPADTAASAPARPAAPVPAAAPALRDTNTLTLRAVAGPLRGIRVRVDDDARRPYWLEQGTERAFSFRDSVFVYSPRGGAAILVNGAPVDTTALRAADGTVRIVRR